MAKTNQVKDTYNPPSVSSPLFEEMLFSEVEVEDLFWLKEGGIDNPPYSIKEKVISTCYEKKRPFEKL